MRIKIQFVVELNFKLVFSEPTIEISADEINNAKWVTASMTEEEQDENKI